MSRETFDSTLDPDATVTSIDGHYTKRLIILNIKTLKRKSLRSTFSDMKCIIDFCPDLIME